MTAVEAPAMAPPAPPARRDVAAPDDEPGSQDARKKRRKLLLVVLRWTVAVAGIAWVLTKISLHDRAELLDAHNRPVEVTLAESPADTFATVNVASPSAFKGEHSRSQLVNKPDLKKVTLTSGQTVPLLAVDLEDNLRTRRRLLVADDDKSDGRWITPDQVAGENSAVPNTPYPLIDRGIKGMLAKADPLFLWGAVLIFPMTYLITSYRWYILLDVLEIGMSLPRAFVLNMVGAFYNTFMPGSTGGDLLKAYYASKLTPHRTRAVMSVLVDRIIGLLALVILGGVSAAYQWRVHACQRVAIASGAIISCVIIGLTIFYTPILRKMTGLDFIIKKMPMQRQVRAAVDAMELYRRRPLTVLWSLLISLPVHGTVVLSASFAGLAFGILRDHPLYFWVAVPVIVLSGSIPISPQGVGVMEGFAILLLKPEGGTIAQAFALTMSIRMVQILWNLTGGLFVLRGGFHAPTDQEQHTMDTDAGASAVQPA